MKRIVKFTMIISFIFFVLGTTLNLETEIVPRTDESFIIILSHNIKVEFFTIAISIFTLGTYSLIYLFNNFVMLGHIVRVLIIKYGILKGISFIVPHGIFEVPTIILTSSLALYIPLSILKNIYLYKKINFKNVKKFIIYILFMIVMSFISAFIETYFTTRLLKSIL